MSFFSNELKNDENQKSVENCLEISEATKGFKINKKSLICLLLVLVFNLPTVTIQFIRMSPLSQTLVVRFCVMSYNRKQISRHKKFLYGIVNWQSKKKLQETSTVPDFQRWKMQNKVAFGFIPLSPVIGVNNWQENDTVHFPIDGYQLVTNSGAYKHRLRVLLKNKLNLAAWEELLQDYWDWKLVQYIKFRFPLDVKPDAQLKCDFS